MPPGPGRLADSEGASLAGLVEVRPVSEVTWAVTVPSPVSGWSTN